MSIALEVVIDKEQSKGVCCTLLGHYLLHISFSSGTFSKVHAGGRPYHYTIIRQPQKSSAPGSFVLTLIAFRDFAVLPSVCHVFFGWMA